MILAILNRLWLPFLFGCYCILFYFAIEDMSSESSLYPTMLIAINLFLIPLVTIGEVSTVLRERRDRGARGVLRSDQQAMRRRTVYAMGWFAAFAYATPRVGFTIASSVLVAGLMLSLGARNPVRIGAAVLGSAAVVELVFIRFFQILLPEGTWF